MREETIKAKINSDGVDKQNMDSQSTLLQTILHTVSAHI